MRRNKLWTVILAAVFCVGLSITFFTAKYAETSAADSLYALSFNDRGSSFKKENLEYLQEQRYCFTFAATQNVEAVSKLKTAKVELISTNSDYAALHKLDGTFFNTAHEEKSVDVAVLNTASALHFFGNTECSGESIRMNGINYTIVGVIEDGDERRVYIPSDGADVNIYEIVVVLDGRAYVAPLIKSLGYTSDEMQVFDLPQYTEVMWQRYDLLIFLGGVCIIIRVLSELRREAGSLIQGAREHFAHSYLWDSLSSQTRRYVLLSMWRLCSVIVLVVLVGYAIRFTPCIPSNFFSLSMDYTSISSLIEFFLQEQAATSFSYLNNVNAVSNLAFFLSLTAGALGRLTADA